VEEAVAAASVRGFGYPYIFKHRAPRHEIPDQSIVTLLIGLLLKCWRKSVSVDQKIHIKNEERMSNAATTRAT
jgi:hypothetical protein